MATCWKAAGEDGNGNAHESWTDVRAVAAAVAVAGTGTGTGPEGGSADRILTSPPTRVQPMMGVLLKKVQGWRRRSRNAAPPCAHEESCSMTTGLTNERPGENCGGPGPSGDQTPPGTRCSCSAERTLQVPGRMEDSADWSSPRAHAG